ncbi:MAG TPA: glycosyltransferase [Chitinophagaceae bacterium]
MSTSKVITELIVSIDNTDPERHKYEQFYPKKNIIVNDNKSVVEATNRAAKEAKGDILIYLSDDFDCPENWGPLVLKEFEGVEGPCLLKVDDCLQPFHVPVLTIPIMNRALYERLNYFWHPEYKSMFVDEDLYQVCKKNNWLKLAPHLKFSHNHVSVGKAQDDETYRRSAANWDQGKALFARRKAQGFPI